jgi:hypothetical protein
LQVCQWLREFKKKNISGFAGRLQNVSEITSSAWVLVQIFPKPIDLPPQPTNEPPDSYKCEKHENDSCDDQPTPHRLTSSLSIIAKSQALDFFALFLLRVCRRKGSHTAQDGHDSWFELTEWLFLASLLQNDPFTLVEIELIEQPIWSCGFPYLTMTQALKNRCHGER